MLVIVTDSVFAKPTVIVPKSMIDGLIWILPSLPAPIIVRVFSRDFCCPCTDWVIDFIEEISLLLRAGLGIWSPDPGAKNPIYCLIGSKRFLAKIGMLIWYSLTLRGVKQA